MRFVEAVERAGAARLRTRNRHRLLRGTQGKPGKILRAGYYEDAKEFPLDSLFCEWGYLVDLDAGTLEVYRGFQKSSPTEGRWAGRPTLEEQRADHEAHVKWCRENDRVPWKSAQPEYHDSGIASRSSSTSASAVAVCW